MAKPKQNLDLVTQGVQDIKFRLSRNDILDLCISEARLKLDTAFDLQRGKCINLRTKVQAALQKVEDEARIMMKKRYAKVLKALEGDHEPHVNVSVVYTTTAELALSRGGRKNDTETRPSYTGGFRISKSRVESVKMSVGSSIPDYGSPKRTGYCFEAAILAADLGEDFKAMEQLHEAVRELHRAGDRLDELHEEQLAFKKRSQSAKQVLMKKILGSSEKGREILELAKTLSVEVDASIPKALDAFVIDA